MKLNQHSFLVQDSLHTIVCEANIVAYHESVI